MSNAIKELSIKYPNEQAKILTDTIKQIMNTNNGMLSTRMIEPLNISRQYLSIMENNNDIEKVNIKKTKAYGCVEIFKELSELLDCMDIKEFSFKDRIAWQKEFLGYINLTTGLDEDRKKLFITSMRPIIAKKGRHAGKAWCRIITTHSIGRGIDGEWWVLEETYQKYYRFNEGDIIIAGKVRPEKYQDKKQWWLDSYELCMD